LGDRLVTVWLIVLAIAIVLLLHVDYLHYQNMTTQSFTLRMESGVMSALLITAVVLPVLARLYKH